MTTGKIYYVQVKGVTKGHINTSALFEGQASEPRSIYLHKDCVNSNNSSSEFVQQLLIGLCCVFGLLIIVAAVLFWQ